MKPELSIKRATADWPKIVLQNLLRGNKLSDLIDGMNNKHASKEQYHEIEGQLRIYVSRAAALEAISTNKPFLGMLDEDGSVWIAYRPTKV